jgi:hypothetical protein
MFNLNKFIAGVVAVVAFALPTTFGMVTDPVETAMAVEWAYENELTMFNTVESFMPNGTLTREQGAKFTSAWAVLNLCMEPGTDACDFSDLATADPTLADYATLACQLGLFKGSDGKFMPQAPFTKAQFVTVMMRALDGMQDENVSPRWANYFMAAKEAGITNEASAQALDKAITRAEAVVMLYRARSSDCENDTTDLEELLKDLFGDVDGGTDTGTGTGTDTEEEVIVPVSNGTLKCAISSTSPAGATVPGGVSVSVAHYECTATTEAVTVDSFELSRQGIADSNAISRLSIFANGDLVSRNRSFNSDAKANVTFSPKVTVKAGETIKFDVVATLGSGNNQRVKVALTDFMSNGKNDKSALPAVGNQFEIVNVTPAKVEVKSVGSIADIRLGQTNMIVARFDIRNTSSDNNDVTINSVTLRDLESRVQKNLKNFVLKQGTTTVATLASTSSKSVSFQLAEGVVLPRGQSKTFTLYADVVDGAGDMIDLQINESIYVLGSDSRYGYGIMVDTVNYGSQKFTITAGKVTLARMNNPSRKVRADKRDVILANFNVTANETASLLLEDIKFKANTGVNVNFENPELHVYAGTTRIGTYNLTNGGSDTEYSDTDMSISLPKNTALNFKLVADVKPALANTGWLNKSFQYSLMASGNVRILESTDDKKVTDIVPGSITFDSMTFVDSTFQISPNSLSNITAVKGATNVEALRFNILTSEVSPVRIDSLSVSGTGLNSNQVAAVRLYKGVYPNGTLVDETSQFSSNAVTFNNVSVEVPAQSTQPMYVTVDTVSTIGVIGNIVVSQVLARDSEDNQSLTPVVGSIGATSNRVINVNNNGEMTVSTNTIDSKVSKAKVIAGGTTSDEVMAFEINLTNDTALLKNVRLAVSGANINTVISNAMLVTSTGAVVDAVAESIGSELVFNNINYALPAGTTRLFVKVAAKSIGLNREANAEGGPFALSVEGVDVEWNADGQPLTKSPTTLSLSREFSVRAVKVTNIAITSAGANFGGLVTNPTKVANVVFTADATSNTSTGGSDVKAKVHTVKFSLGGAISANLDATGTIRDNGGSNIVADCTIASSVATCTSTGSQLLIDQGSSTTFGLFLTRGATPPTTVTNDALTIGVANIDTDITVLAANTNGTDAYTPAQVGLFLPTTSSVANVQLYRH